MRKISTFPISISILSLYFFMASANFSSAADWCWHFKGNDGRNTGTNSLSMASNYRSRGYGVRCFEADSLVVAQRAAGMCSRKHNRYYDNIPLDRLPKLCNGGRVRVVRPGTSTAAPSRPTAAPSRPSVSGNGDGYCWAWKDRKDPRYSISSNRAQAFPPRDARTYLRRGYNVRCFTGARARNVAHDCQRSYDLDRSIYPNVSSVCRGGGSSRVTPPSQTSVAPQPQTRLYKVRWKKVGGHIGARNWTSTWVYNQREPICGAGQNPNTNTHRCRCGGINYCGKHRVGTVITYWSWTCETPPWRIQCEAVLQ